MRPKVSLQTLILFSLCFLFFTLGSFKGFWEDELALLADVICSDSFFEMIRQFKYEVHAPGLYLIIYVLNKLSLNNELALRVPSLIAACFGLIAFSKIGRHYMKTSWVFAFVLLSASSAVLYWHATEVRPHIFLFAFGSWILFYLHEAMLNEESENFYSSVKKSVYLFTISLFFHFGTLFIFLVFFLPFFILYRKKFLVTRDRFLGKSRFVIYPILVLLLILAAYLFYKNISSVMWMGLATPDIVLTNYYEYSFGSMTYGHILQLLSLSLILVAALKRKLGFALRYILICYIFAFLTLLLLAVFDVPFGRPRYNLYLLPIPVLITFISISTFKFSKLFETVFFALTAAVVYFNFSEPNYAMDLSPKVLLERASVLMQDHPQSHLVVIGNCRNLTYYLNEFHFSEKDNLTCFTPMDYLEKWTFNDHQKTYVFAHMSADFRSVLHNLHGKVIMRANRILLFEANYRP